MFSGALSSVLCGLHPYVLAFASWLQGPPGHPSFPGNVEAENLDLRVPYVLGSSPDSSRQFCWPQATCLSLSVLICKGKANSILALVINYDK